MYRLHTHCRACGYAKAEGSPYSKSTPSKDRLLSAFDLGLHPLANSFSAPDGLQSPFYPLEVLMCPRCHLAQLSCVVPASDLYSNYAYVTSKSDTMKSHFGALWKAIKSECNPESVVEIGSNTGDFLEFAKANGSDAVCGIDPAENLAEEAEKKGVSTFRSVFDDQSAQMARGSMPPVSLVVARHVFCHVNDWVKFVKSLELLGGKEMVVVIEVPYVMDMLGSVSFDTIYHEHLSYLNLQALEYLLRDSQFQLHKVVKYQIHGGSVAVMLRRRTSGIKPDESVRRMVGEEIDSLTMDRWIEFGVEANRRILELRDFVLDKIKAGKSVVGYGASAKSTVWVNACGFTNKHIRFICDSTPQKQYKTSPGTDIPIVDEGALTRERPDYAICFAWNFFPEIKLKEKLFIQNGGRWILPHSV